MRGSRVEDTEIGKQGQGLRKGRPANRCRQFGRWLGGFLCRLWPRAVLLSASIGERLEGRAADHAAPPVWALQSGNLIEESDGDLMSNGVSIAARLEGIADPGGICLSEDAYRQVRDRVSEGLTDLGEKQLKNIARPVRGLCRRDRRGRASVVSAPLFRT
jgi:hypothetical protein